MHSLRQLNFKDEKKTEKKSSQDKTLPVKLVNQSTLSEIIRLDEIPDNSHYFIQLADLMFIAARSDYYMNIYPHAFIIDIENPQDYYKINIDYTETRNFERCYAISQYKDHKKFAILSPGCVFHPNLNAHFTFS